LLTVILNSLKLVLRDSLGNKLLTVLITDGLHLGNDFVHQGLGESGLIEFVVPEFPVANQVDDDVTVELLSELGGKLEGALDILHTVSIDVENWRVNCFGNVGGVDAGSCLAWGSCETDLVVYNNVDSTTYFVVVKRLHLQLLEHDTLTSEGSVSVHNDWDDCIAGRLVPTEGMLLGTDTTHHYWVDSFQMGRVSQ
jgi:hypothetical protein